jgi:glycine cleavage system H protein
MLKYTKDHEWISLDGDTATVGITSFAQEKLGDLVFAELPDVGTKLATGATAATVESVKAAADVYAPVNGTVSAVNEKLASEPGLVNASPMAEGWLFRMRVADPQELDGLMDEQAYQDLVSRS